MANGGDRHHPLHSAFAYVRVDTDDLGRLETQLLPVPYSAKDQRGNSPSTPKGTHSQVGALLPGRGIKDTGSI